MNVVFISIFLSVSILGIPSSACGQFVSRSPSKMLLEPAELLKVWDSDPIPLAHYSFEEKEIQDKVNREQSHQIVTFLFNNHNSAWSQIDAEPITPYTWKWVDLKLVKADGSISWASLRRPNWWLQKIGADKVANAVFIDMPEMGMVGWAIVIDIRVNRLDTRIWEFENSEGGYTQPITGKFKHISENTYWLHFLGEHKVLGVTGSHLIWSESREKWVPASNLRKGEKVKSFSGFVELEAIEKSNKQETVYNLEVYRDHNFYASLNSVLVHNECWNVLWDKVWHAWGVKATKVGGKHGLFVGRTEGKVRRVMVDFKQTPKGDLNNFFSSEVTERVDNIFLKNLELEEGLAKIENADKIVIKMMVEDVTGVQLRSGIENLQHLNYGVREYNEFGMKWLEATRTLQQETFRPPAFKKSK